MRRIFWVAMCLGLVTVSTEAQWLKHPSVKTPRTADGKPNLLAKAPRMSNGQPDLSGVWQAEPAPLEELMRFLPGGINGLGEGDPSKYFLNILWDFMPENGPARPETIALFQQHAAGFGKDVPSTRCLPTGMPLLETLPEPHKIVQTPELIVTMYESGTAFRQIHTDGRKLPVDPQPTWQGYSVGRWERDWLVVDIAGFNDRSWLDAFGHVHSDAMRITERMRRRDFGHMDVEMTIDDPKAYTQPFTIKFTKRLMPDTDLLESFCAENEKDVQHMGIK
jgi:hypothetical protein